MSVHEMEWWENPASVKPNEFEQGFICGMLVGNKKSGGGGSSGDIIINEGTSVYDVPIIRNYNLTGTNFGIAVFDLNECAFMNNAPLNGNRPEYYRHRITNETITYVDPPRSVNRRIGYALTKGGKAIGIFQAGQSASYEVFSDGTYGAFIEDGSLYPKKDIIKSSKIKNPVLTWTVSPYGSTMVQLKVYMEYDIVTETIKYTQPPKLYYNDEYGFKYYLKSDLDAQVVESTTTSTNHPKIQIFSTTAVTTLLEGDDYPKEWLNKYNLSGGFPYPIFGASIMDSYEFTTSLFEGIA